MSSHSGRVSPHQSTRPVTTEAGRAAYSSGDLHPTSAPTGRYAMPTEGRPYKWRDPARFWKLPTMDEARRNGLA